MLLCCEAVSAVARLTFSSSLSPTWAESSSTETCACVGVLSRSSSQTPQRTESLCTSWYCRSEDQKQDEPYFKVNNLLGKFVWNSSEGFSQTTVSHIPSFRFDT